jgi:hypothetical protein
MKIKTIQSRMVKLRDEDIKVLRLTGVEENRKSGLVYWCLAVTLV